MPRSTKALQSISHIKVDAFFAEVGQKLRECRSGEAEKILVETLARYSHTPEDFANLNRLLSFTLETVGRYKESLAAILPLETDESFSSATTIGFDQPDALLGQLLDGRFLIERNLADSGADAGGRGVNESGPRLDRARDKVAPGDHLWTRIGSVDLSSDQRATRKRFEAVGYVTTGQPHCGSNLLYAIAAGNSSALVYRRQRQTRWPKIPPSSC